MIRLEIQNDRTGNDERASYNVRLHLPTGRRVAKYALITARVENYPRSEGWEELAHRAIEALAERISSS